MSDKEKNTNIYIEQIFLIKSNCFRTPKLPKELKIDRKINILNKLTKDKDKLLCEFEFSIFPITKEFEIGCTFIGIFKQTEKGNITLEEFSKFNAPALLYPYIREYVSNMSLRLQVSPLYLPPENFSVLLKDAEEKHKQES